MYLSACMLPTSVGEFVYFITVYELFASIEKQVNKIYCQYCAVSLAFSCSPFHEKEYNSWKIYLLYHYEWKMRARDPREILIQ